MEKLTIKNIKNKIKIDNFLKLIFCFFLAGCSIKKYEIIDNKKMIIINSILLKSKSFPSSILENTKIG